MTALSVMCADPPLGQLGPPAVYLRPAGDSNQWEQRGAHLLLDGPSHPKGQPAMVATQEPVETTKATFRDAAWVGREPLGLGREFDSTIRNCSGLERA
jgi:hypothetical protein